MKIERIKKREKGENIMRLGLERDSNNYNFKNRFRGINDFLLSTIPLIARHLS